MKRLLLIFALSLPGFASVALNNANTITQTLGASATLTMTVTAPCTPTCALIVGIGFDHTSSDTIDSVTWNGVAMTRLCGPTAASAHQAYAVIYGLASPATGSNTLQINGTNTDETYVNAVSFTGVDPGMVRSATCQATVGTGTTAAQTLTSAVGDMTFTVLDSGGVTISSSSQTSDGISNAGSFAGGTDHAAGAATVTHTWTMGGSSTGWAMAGFSIQAAAAASGGATVVGAATIKGAATVK